MFERLAIRLGRFLFFSIIGFSGQTAISLESCLPLADDLQSNKQLCICCKTINTLLSKRYYYVHDIQVNTLRVSLLIIL